MLYYTAGIQKHVTMRNTRNDAQHKERCYVTRRQHQRRDVLMLSYKHIRTCIYQGCIYLPRTLLLRQSNTKKKTGELPTSLPMGCTWATEWAARGLPMGILPCKLGCPLLPYMETVGNSVGSSVGSPLLRNMKKVGSSVGSGVGCPWAAHGNFAMQIRLPTTSIYGNSGQLSGQPTTSKHEKSGQLSGQWSGLPMCCPWEFCRAN